MYVPYAPPRPGPGGLPNGFAPPGAANFMQPQMQQHMQQPQYASAGGGVGGGCGSAYGATPMPALNMFQAPPRDFFAAGAPGQSAQGAAMFAPQALQAGQRPQVPQQQDAGQLQQRRERQAAAEGYRAPQPPAVQQKPAPTGCGGGAAQPWATGPPAPQGALGGPAQAQEPDPDDDPNRLPTFVKVRGLPAEHDPRIARRPKPKKRAPGICCA
eukprot:TRINITY_DN14206_c0_g1_i1.p3 TRINITY_DN14206_c0_g1~~TRINITY_DN14206_c0_g1_i1.p3  ORF type:complete len:213 (+),score=50.62 TRINITY_DN14206_c0_g1_i1:73-711(+)